MIEPELSASDPLVASTLKEATPTLLRKYPNAILLDSNIYMAGDKSSLSVDSVAIELDG